MTNNFLMILIFSIAINSNEIAIINGIFWSLFFINAVLVASKIIDEEFLEESFFILLTYFPIEKIIISKILITSFYLIAFGIINIFFIFFIFNSLIISFYLIVFLIISSFSISSISVMLNLMLYKVNLKNILTYLLYIPLSIPIFLSSLNGSVSFKVDWLFLSLICLFLYNSFALFYSEWIMK